MVYIQYNFLQLKEKSLILIIFNIQDIQDIQISITITIYLAIKIVFVTENSLRIHRLR